MNRRDFLKLSGATSLAVVLAARGYPMMKAFAAPAAFGLSDPALQPKFVNLVPNAADPAFSFSGKKNSYTVEMGQVLHQTGLVDGFGAPLSTPVWGYGEKGVYTWPGKTIFAQSGVPVEVKWKNKLIDPLTGLPLDHLLPVDTSLHWAYSLPGYTGFSIPVDGVPVVAHLHGGHTDFPFDGNPEFFFSPGYTVRGPRWMDKTYFYDNSQPAGTLWYHDHALGITRLNVYAGLAGFYLLRDNDDTGLVGNPLDLPAFPYEAAFAIQDRMFRDTGELFYPAFPGDPFYDDFIDADVNLPPGLFPGGGPTGLAEFFGDHMVVNGMIWPKMDVERRNYRFRLLNGTDSRFMVLRFRQAANSGSTDLNGAGDPISFTVIGSDQGLASSPTSVTELLFEPGARYDIIFDFKSVPFGSRVIMENIGGDAPFGGDYGDALGPDDFFPDRQTDRVMAFDVVLSLDAAVPDVSPTGINFGPSVPTGNDRLRKVALFEGRDEFGRLQPVLGTAEPATDYMGIPINYPNMPMFSQAMMPDGTPYPLTGQMEGGQAWHAPTTENPALGSTEEWEIWNMTGDAHPVHLHLVHFEVVGRQEIVMDSNTDEDGFLLPGGANGDGAYMIMQPAVQHNSVGGDPTTYGIGFRIGGTDLADSYGPTVDKPTVIVENTPKDMVTALPGQITRIRAHFDKPGHYVWHCHILSHEDHEMMRVLHVGPGA